MEFSSNGHANGNCQVDSMSFPDNSEYFENGLYFKQSGLYFETWIIFRNLADDVEQENFSVLYGHLKSTDFNVFSSDSRERG
ncbi:hypothetical protein CEXT_654041 [Caerostris extrusa]|uniref:Uncharacterized protein n=1 Tax=Caerostris extrusa TaxID=172846 RepID=A0AAV4SQD9_CAEEX|nr:hypothetical protein CEXT_654041 [Caerostris extrusa]